MRKIHVLCILFNIFRGCFSSWRCRERDLEGNFRFKSSSSYSETKSTCSQLVYYRHRKRSGKLFVRGEKCILIFPWNLRWDQEPLPRQSQIVCVCVMNIHIMISGTERGETVKGYDQIWRKMGNLSGAKHETQPYKSKLQTACEKS